MRIYIVVFFAVIFLYSTEAAGRKKIITTTKITETKSSSNATDTVKGVDKTTYPKKATSLKKRPTKSPQFITENATLASSNTIKSPNEVTEIFKNLPEDDFEFIQELDKQFKIHGGKLKIKVERDNTTNTGKNSKRTIEGDLGYGYAHNGYTYEPPKFMFYPYSQKDIPSDAPAYYPQYESTSVTIEPSYSYELKPQTYLVQHGDNSHQIDLPQSSHEQIPQQHEQSHQQNDYQEPVIVLRIPGPTKYATHLQSLLQQYLEIRAAQYLHILQETEARKQQSHSQHYEEESISQQHNYEQQQPAQHVEPPAPNYSADADYSHQNEPTPQPVMYPAIDEVYHSYKERQQYQPQQHFEHQQQQQQQHQQDTTAELYQQHQHQHQVDAEPQYYYPSEQDIQHQQGHSAYQQVYLIAMDPAAYSNIEQHYGPPQQPIYVQEDNHHLETTENNPRPTHTKIIFSPGVKNSAHDHSNMYVLPSIKPFDRHAPTSIPHNHQLYQEQYEEQYQQHATADLDFQQSAPAESAPHQETVAITQRPFNYHAHSSKIRGHGGRKRAATATTTTAAPNHETSKSVDETEKQIRKYVHEKLGARTGSAIEIKSTKIVNG